MPPTSFLVSTHGHCAASRRLAADASLIVFVTLYRGFPVSQVRRFFSMVDATSPTGTETCNVSCPRGRLDVSRLLTPQPLRTRFHPFIRLPDKLLWACRRVRHDLRLQPNFSFDNGFDILFVEAVDPLRIRHHLARSPGTCCAVLISIVATHALAFISFCF